MPMSLEEIVLQKLAEWRPPREGNPALAIADADSGCVVRLTAQRQDQLGTALLELTVDRSKATAPSDLTVAAWAEHIAGRTRGLLEPLSVLEVDAQRNEALLRSNEPAQRKDELYYYEVHLYGAREAQVHRYRAAHDGSKRQQVPFTLTHESLARFASDLASI
jgi:hypothetical protein